MPVKKKKNDDMNSQLCLELYVKHRIVIYSGCLPVPVLFYISLFCKKTNDQNPILSATTPKVYIQPKCFCMFSGLH